MITIDQTIEALNKAVEEKGADYVYPVGEPGYSDEKNGCRYKSEEDETVPLCIVGHVLNQFGFLKFADEGKSAEALFVIDNQFDLFSKNLLTLAQWSQDDSKTWGESVEYALEGYTAF